MTENPYKIKIGDKDKMELYKEFFKEMINLGYSPEFIGRELAHIARALEQANED